MKNTLLLLLLATQVLFAQSSHDFLKTNPYINSETPEWAKEMYKLNPDVLTTDKLYQDYYNNHKFVKNIHTQNYSHWRRLVEPFLEPTGYIKIPDAKQLLTNQEAILNKKISSKKSANSWKAIGPFETYSTGQNQVPVSWQANVYTIDQSITNPDVLYVGTEAGGIFKSIDKGINWFMVSAETTIRTVRSIKINPSNDDIVYAGDGTSIYKTIDGGQNWTILFTKNSLAVNDISINPENTSIVLVAANDGLFRSTDAGTTWQQIYTETIWDIEVKYGSPNEIYILKSNPLLVRTEFWKSINFGESFELKDQGWYNSNNINRINGGGRMTITPADPNRIYTILIGASKQGDNGYIGIYKSYDSGENWDLSSPPVGGPYDNNHPNLATLNNTNTLQQGYYNLGIAASHKNADEVLIGCLNLWKTLDGGTTFEAIGGYQGSVSWIHPDQQEIEILGDDMWIANDGGINYSTDLFSTHESRKRGLLASEYWGFASGWNSNLIVGGRYHNGNSAYRPSFGNGEFLRLGGGEASTGYIQPNQESIAYFSDIAAKKIPYQLDQVVTDVPAYTLFPSESYFASHSSELVYDKSYYKHIWLGRENKLYKSIDNGNNFSVIKEFGDADDPIMQFELNGKKNQVLYVYQRTSFYGATLWVSTDSGSTWEEKSFPQNVSSMRAGAITAHWNKPGTLWVSFAHQNNDGAKIFRSDDYGDTWKNLSEEILDGETIHTLVHQHGTDNDIYIGTDFSIYHHDGISWSLCSDGLPKRFNSNKLIPYYALNKLRVASYGNGVWESDLINPSRLIAHAMVDKEMSNCARDTFYFADHSIANDNDQLNYEWSFSPEPIFISDKFAKNPKVVFGNTGTFSVTLLVSSIQVSDIYTNDSMVIINEDNCSPEIFPSSAVKMLGSGDDYIQMNNLDVELTEFTLTAWLYPTQIQNDYTGIIFNDDESIGLNFSVNNQLGFHHPSAGADAWAWQSGLVVPTNQWSYVAISVDTSGATLYLNGVAAERKINLEAVTLETFKIGSYKGWNSRNYVGDIDEVTIWKKALTTEEIRNHRHITKTQTNAPGLIAYYQFNQTDANVLDLVGNTHGVLKGSSVLITSTAPVGGGEAKSSNELASSIHNYDDLNIEIEAQLEDQAMLTVSQIRIAPQNLNVSNPFPQDSFWIINSYGVIDVNGLKIQDIELESTFIGNADKIELYTRNENNNIDSWTLGGNANSVSNTPQSINFNNTDILGKQLILSKPQISNTSNINSTAYLAYPNPTEGNLTIKNLEEKAEIYIYDSKGNLLVRKGILPAQKIDLTKNLPHGVYPYILKIKDGLKTGKIIIAQ